MVECYTPFIVNKYTRKNFLRNVLLGLVAVGINLGLAYVSILGLIRFFGSLFSAKLPTFSLEQSIFSVVAVLALLTEVYFFKNADKWLQGDEGERAVGQQLHKLPSQYIVLENLVLDPKHSNLDFVVIGPKGVAVVEVKSHRGWFTFHDKKIFRNGQSQTFIWQVESQANELVTTLKTRLRKFIPVHPFIAFSSRFARMRFGSNILPGTQTIAVRIEWIKNCILGQKGSYLDESEINNIADFLKKYQQD